MKNIVEHFAKQGIEVFHCEACQCLSLMCPGCKKNHCGGHEKGCHYFQFCERKQEEIDNMPIVAEPEDGDPIEFCVYLTDQDRAVFIGEYQQCVDHVRNLVENGWNFMAIDIRYVVDGEPGRACSFNLDKETV